MLCLISVYTEEEIKDPDVNQVTLFHCSKELATVEKWISRLWMGSVLSRPEDVNVTVAAEAVVSWTVTGVKQYWQCSSVGRCLQVTSSEQPGGGHRAATFITGLVNWKNGQVIVIGEAAIGITEIVANDLSQLLITSRFPWWFNSTLMRVFEDASKTRRKCSAIKGPFLNFSNVQTYCCGNIDAPPSVAVSECQCLLWCDLDSGSVLCLWLFFLLFCVIISPWWSVMFLSAAVMWGWCAVTLQVVSMFCLWLKGLWRLSHSGKLMILRPGSQLFPTGIHNCFILVTHCHALHDSEHMTRLSAHCKHDAVIGSQTVVLCIGSNLF